MKTEISAQKGKSPVRENNRNDLFGLDTCHLAYVRAKLITKVTEWLPVGTKVGPNLGR